MESLSGLTCREYGLPHASTDASSTKLPKRVSMREASAMTSVSFSGITPVSSEVRFTISATNSIDNVVDAIRSSSVSPPGGLEPVGRTDSNKTMSIGSSKLFISS